MNKFTDKQYPNQAIDSLITVDQQQWLPGPSPSSVSQSLDCQLSPDAPKNYRSLFDLITDLVVTKTVTPAPEWSANHVTLQPCVFKPAGERFTTIDDLNDDCLIALLSKVSFMDQILTVPLTCHRWNGLLPQVHRERTKLVIWNPSLRVRSIANDEYHFLSEATVTAARYTEYLNFLLNKENWGQLCPPNREFFSRRFLDPPISKTIINSFPNLIHLSLVGVIVLPGTIFRLLGHSQSKLQSLYLDLFIHREANESYEQICDAIRPIWALIDSMGSLRQLGLKLGGNLGDSEHLNLASALSTILPGLEEFQVTNYENYIFPVLLRLEETKLRRLSLRDTRWPGRFLFYQLLRAKPGLSALTHLTVGEMHIEVKGRDSHRDWGTFLLRQIVHFLPRLEYLNLAFQKRSPMHLSDILPQLCKLKKLAHLEVEFRFWKGKQCHISKLLDDRLLSWSAEELASNRIDSLQVLIPIMGLIEIEHLPRLALLLPRLSQLYLNGSIISCKCSERSRFFNISSPSLPGCTCKKRFVGALASFESLPKIVLQYE